VTCMRRSLLLMGDSERTRDSLGPSESWFTHKNHSKNPDRCSSKIA
jgi:hypothetical protein